MYYFAYGSNMSLRRLRQRVPGVAVRGRAFLPGYDLRFHKVGSDGSGKCDAFQTGDDRDVLYGLLFHLPPMGKPVLDRIEGLGAGYDDRRVAVHLTDGDLIEATTYVATRLDPLLLPFCWYKQHVLAWAREAALPRHYLAQIRALPVIRDPNPRRRARERAVYRSPPRQ